MISVEIQNELNEYLDDQWNEKIKTVTFTHPELFDKSKVYDLIDQRFMLCLTFTKCNVKKTKKYIDHFVNTIKDAAYIVYVRASPSLYYFDKEDFFDSKKFYHIYLYMRIALPLCDIVHDTYNLRSVETMTVIKIN